jgi:hypothetical protein
MGLFSTLAIILSAVGLFGVVSYSVGQQVAALAVRMAWAQRERTSSGWS